MSTMGGQKWLSIIATLIVALCVTFVARIARADDTCDAQNQTIAWMIAHGCGGVASAKLDETQCQGACVATGGVWDADAKQCTLPDQSGIEAKDRKVLSANKCALVKPQRPACAPGTDPDKDGICNPKDNCPNKANPKQADSDGDGVGNECDNCIQVPNGPKQESVPGVGNQLDTYMVSDKGAATPYPANAVKDGIGDACSYTTASLHSELVARVDVLEQSLREAGVEQSTLVLILKFAKDAVAQGGIASAQRLRALETSEMNAWNCVSNEGKVPKFVAGSNQEIVFAGCKDNPLKADIDRANVTANEAKAAASRAGRAPNVRVATEAVVVPGTGSAFVGGVDIGIQIPGTEGTRVVVGPRVGTTAALPGSPNLAVGGVAGIESDVARGSGGHIALGVRGVGITALNPADRARNTAVVVAGQFTASGCARLGRNGSVCLDAGIGPGHVTVRGEKPRFAPIFSIGPSLTLEWGGE